MQLLTTTYSLLLTFYQYLLLLEQMQKLDPNQLVAEIRGYLCPSAELRKLMGGVLALLGHETGWVAEWEMAKVSNVSK